MRSVYLTAAVLCVGLVGAEQAMACSCIATSTRDALEQSDAALVGKLVEVDRVSNDTLKLSYRVKRVFKGPPGLNRGDRLTLRSLDSEAACGLPHRRDKRYGLLLDRRNKRLTANLCSVVPPKKLRRAADGKAKGKLCGRA
jgi:hypothetical protein